MDNGGISRREQAILTMEERWVPIKRNTAYEVSDLGHIRRVEAGRGARIGKILKASSNGRYLQVGLYRSNKVRRELVHIIVAEAFIGPRPEGCEVNHQDGCRGNNSASNLEYCTPKENMEHASRKRLLAFGSRNKSTKLTDSQVEWIRREVANGRSRHSVAAEIGICFQHASDIVNGKKRASVYVI